MLRSAAAFAAVLTLSTGALAQSPERTHTVVRDDTLWGLALRYYQNPWEWRVIWEANRPRIEDPNLIYPDQVFVIPNVAAERVAQEGPPSSPAGPVTLPPPSGGAPGGAPGDPAVHPADVRTIFYRNEPAAPSVVEMLERAYVAVDRGQVYAAPWLLPPERAVDSLGVVAGPAHEADRGRSLRRFQEVRLRTDEPLRVGERYRLFREEKTIAGVGRVLRPTGLVSIAALEGDGAVAVITDEYERITAGNLLGPIPEYGIEAGRRAQAVEGGTEAMIMGFAGRAVLHDLGHHVFLDLGSDDGIRIGDEFVLYSDAVATDRRGELQVVGLTPFSATARITYMADDVFGQGVIVRLAREMP